MMSAHYSGHDPETGCGLMILGAVIAIAVAFLLVGAKLAGMW